MFSKSKLKFPSALALALLSSAAIPAAYAQDIDLNELTIDQIEAAYAAGTYTAEELTQAYLDKIAIYEDSYNVFTSMNPDALADAAASDAARAAGEPMGPLAGIPVIIKEAMDVAGLPSTVGWPPMAPDVGGLDFTPGTDAPLVARLRAAGAIILGKSNIPQFSSAYNANNSWAGPTYSAICRECSPGGSSAGSATAVAGNLTVLAMGEDTSGSIQAPAGVQGIVGVKTTFALVPTAGIAPLGGSMRDVAGPLARTVRDAALMLDVLAGYTPEDPKTYASVGHIPEGGYTSLLSDTALEGATVGLFGPGFRNVELSPETATLYAASIAEIEGQGATTVADPFAGSGLTDIDTSGNAGCMNSFTYDFNTFLERMGPDVPAHNLAELANVLPADAVADGRGAQLVAPGADAVPDMSACVAARDAIRDTFHKVMDETGVDVFVFPDDTRGTPLREPAQGLGHQPIAVSTINIGGLPGVVVPAGVYENGMPFSLIFIGPEWSEAQLLAYAYDYEQATHHRIVPQLEVYAGDDAAPAAATP